VEAQSGHFIHLPSSLHFSFVDRRVLWFGTSLGSQNFDVANHASRLTADGRIRGIEKQEYNSNTGM